jgi:hypothetical protein
MVAMNICMRYNNQQTTIIIIIYSALLVADQGESLTATPTTTNTENEEKPKGEEIENFQLIKEAQRTFEQRRRTYGDIFAPETDSDDDEKENANDTKTKSSPPNSDSDAPTSTDTDSPYGSDSESSSSYDEYHAERKIPKKKLHKHHKGPFKLYFQEAIGNWPKYRYKKYKRRHMKKHGIQINYGNIHTKAIKHSLKIEKRERTKEEQQAVNVTHMMEDVAKNTSFLSLDPQHPITPIDFDKISLSSSKSIENEHTNTKSSSTLHKMKAKIKKSFKRKHKASANPGTDEEQTATNSDVASRTSGGDELQKSNHSLDKA